MNTLRGVAMFFAGWCAAIALWMASDAEWEWVLLMVLCVGINFFTAYGQKEEKP